MLRDVFSDKKVVENHLLNYAGAQVFRSLLSSAAHTFRGVPKSLSETDLTRKLLRDGYIVLPKFLDRSAFQKVKDEFFNFAGKECYTPISDGDTRSERYTLSSEHWNRLPAVAHLLSDTRLVQALEGAERNAIEIGDVWFDTIYNGDAQKGADSQKELHSDTFFTTHKIWFFIEPVSVEDGPVCFAPGTNRLSWKRLMFEYKKSIHFDRFKDYSFRVEPKDKALLGCEEKPLTCPENTLVIADTSGFHCRGDAVAGHTRKQIHFCIRSNKPFSFS